MLEYMFVHFGLFYSHLVYFVAVWYILWLFGIFLPVLVCYPKKNPVSEPKVFDLHNDLEKPGGWTIYPLLPELNDLAEHADWFLFLVTIS
jgi:hypothetical protein